MYDSVNAAAIPADAEMVAGYVDGAYRWSDADWARFPNATKVRIATQPGTDDGDGCDVERGDLVPAQSRAYVLRRQAAGILQPFVYCGLATVGQVQAACAGLLYWLWIADWTGQPHPLNYAAAVQYADGKMLGTGYDLSIVYSDRFPGPHVPETAEGEPMTTAEREDLASALTQLSYACGLRRDPAKDQTGVDYWFSQYVKSFGEAAKEFIAAPEMQKDLGAA